MRGNQGYPAKTVGYPSCRIREQTVWPRVIAWSRLKGTSPRKTLEPPRHITGVSNATGSFAAIDLCMIQSAVQSVRSDRRFLWPWRTKNDSSSLSRITQSPFQDRLAGICHYIPYRSDVTEIIRNVGVFLASGRLSSQVIKRACPITCPRLGTAPAAPCRSSKRSHAGSSQHPADMSLVLELTRQKSLKEVSPLPPNVRHSSGAIRSVFKLVIRMLLWQELAPCERKLVLFLEGSARLVNL